MHHEDNQGDDGPTRMCRSANEAGVDGHAVLRGLHTLHHHISDLSNLPAWSMNDTESRSAVTEAYRLVARTHAAALQLLADLNTRPDAVPGSRPGRGGQTLLRTALHLRAGAARDEVAAASAITATAGTPGALPSLGQALADGLTTREHLDVMVKALRKIPGHLQTGAADLGALLEIPGFQGQEPDPQAGPVTGAHAIDAIATHAAVTACPGTLNQIGRAILTTLAPDVADRYDPAAHERRGLHQTTDDTGMCVGSFQLDPAATLIWTQAIDYYASLLTPSATIPSAAEGPTTHPGTDVGADSDLDASPALRPPPSPDADEDRLPDLRTPAQRRADAMTAVAQAALRYAAQAHEGTADGIGGPGTLILLHATPDQIAAARHGGCGTSAAESPVSSCPADASASSPSGAPRRVGSEDRPTPGLAWSALTGQVSPRTLGQLLCDSTMQAVVLDGSSRVVLDLGRTRRLASPQQRRAVAARDRGCVIPGCAAPPSHCQVHHIIWWSEGGPTDLDNLALVCQRHHTEIHLGIWDVHTEADRTITVRPPAWLDPERRPRRNRTHDLIDQARRITQQLIQPLTDHLGDDGSRPPSPPDTPPQQPPAAA